MKSQTGRFLLAPSFARWCFLGFFALVLAANASATSEPAEIPTITNIRQLTADFPGLCSRSRVAIRLPATVLIGGRASSVAQIDGSRALYALGPAGRELARGDQILLFGDAILDGTNLDLSSPLLIDNDGTHSMVEQKAGAWLEAGDHSLWVDYFNYVGDRGLIVSIQGPDHPLSPIPNDLLFHLETNAATGAVDVRPGLTYQCFRGEWVVMPEFDALEPFQTGLCSNFDIMLGGDTIAYGIEFSGLLRVSQPGYYIFSCASDDGSTVSVGPRQLEARITGKADLAALPLLAAGQPIDDPADSFPAALQGTVTFASTGTWNPTIELSGPRGHAQILLHDIPPLVADNLIGCAVSAQGICRNVLTSDGLHVAGALDSPGREQVTTLEFSPELRRLPLVPLAEAIEMSHARSDSPPLVRVSGVFRPDERGAGWLLADDSTNIPVSNLVGCRIQAGARAEVAGQVSWSPLHQPRLTGLACAVRASSDESAPALTTIKVVKQMTREQARRGYSARVRGVVTFVWPNAGFFIQDATGSIEVRMAPGVASAQPALGDYWEVEGQTFAEFAPDIRATNAAFLGKGILPEPIKPSWQQLIDGSLDTQYVEIQGVVSRADGAMVYLLTRGGRLAVQLPDLAPADLAERQGALVRLRGCLIPGRDLVTQQVKIGQLALRNASISVDRTAPPDPFALPLRSAADLLLFESHASPIEPVRVHGVFLQTWGNTSYLSDGSTGMRVEAVQSPTGLQTGDRIETVGYPDYDGPSLRLRDARIRRVAGGAPPPSLCLSFDRLLDDALDATLVTIRGTLVSSRTAEGAEIFEMRSGTRLWLARLSARAPRPPPLAAGSELEMTGVYMGVGGDRPTGRRIDSFELLLGASSDVVVLSRPSWWTPRHTLALAAGLFAALGLAAIWIGMLRRRVEQRTAELKREVDDHQRTEMALEEKTKLLTQEIEERARMQTEIERGHRQLLLTSRQAGMAEVATSVIHNVGNVLSNVNVLGASISEHVRNSKAANVSRLAALFEDNKQDLAQFVTADTRGRRAPEYLAHLGARLNQEQTALLDLVRNLNDNIEHINEIVATQQSYAKISGVLEKVAANEVIEDALRMHGESLQRHGIELVRRHAPTFPITMDRHKVLQILFNLLENAKHACAQAGGQGRSVTVSLQQEADAVKILVADNGVGIAPEIIGRIFSQGFSTRQNGHGFGLHSSILAAQDMGGALHAHSDGPGQGATFTLVLPLCPPVPVPAHGRKGAGFK